MSGVKEDKKPRTDRETLRKSSPEEQGRSQNQFQNDGSFLEMFRKKMEEQKKVNSKPETKAAAKSTEQKQNSGSASVTAEPEAAFYSPQTISYKDDVDSSKKPQYQVKIFAKAQLKR